MHSYTTKEDFLKFYLGNKFGLNTRHHPAFSFENFSKNFVTTNTCEIPRFTKCIINLMFFSTVHHSIELFHQPTLMHNFLYSLSICLLHYYPRHVSSINMPIFRRRNCIHTASDIFALCKRLHSTLVESGLQCFEH